MADISYTPTTWADGSEGGTPIDATKLNNIEQGVVDAVAAIGPNDTTEDGTLKAQIDSVRESVDSASTHDGNLWMWRFGKVVFASISSGSYTASADGVLFTIPSGFRPVAWAIVYSNNNQSDIRLDFGPDGNVYTRTAITNAAIRISTCWLTS